ncbi:restriction endonuclease subunit S [Clavibacter michiganensis subsp. michiganensis]|nr:restriction endonuclease subunit S [Clavibacter michiganensis subsp. michiganensis]
MTAIRLRYVAEVNPAVPPSLKVMSDQLLSFLPMEAIGEDWSIDLSRRRPVAEVLDAYSYFEDGDVVFAKVTPCFENGKAAVMDGLTRGKGFGTTEITVIRPLGNVSGRFLFYILVENGFKQLGVAEMTGAGGLRRVPDRVVRDYVIDLPSRAAQDAIVEHLDSEMAQIDIFIADQNELLKLLMERRRATIDRAVMGGSISSLGGSNPLESPGRGLPNGWRIGRVRRLLPRVETGTSVNGYPYPAARGEIGVLKTASVSKGYFIPEENKLVTNNDWDRVSTPVRKGSILVNRANSPHLVGSAAFVRDDTPGLFLSDKIWQLDFASGVNQFLYYWMQSSWYKFQIRSLSVGASSSMQNLSYEDFLELKVACPAVHEQRRIATQLDAELSEVDAAISDARLAMRLSNERRAALISRALEGFAGAASAV